LKIGHRQSGIDAMSMRTALRLATAADHAALEGTRMMTVLSSGIPSLDEYRDYLLRQWVLHTALEAALEPWVPGAWVNDRLIKRHWLESDINAIAAVPAVMAKPVATRLHTIASLAEALGTMYVLEGSTLGLRMIEKRLPPGHPGLSAAGRFIRGYGADHGVRWRDFLDCLEGLPPEAWPEAIAAAGATFRLFLEHFRNPQS
jgi:heme oxygenase